MADTMKQAYYKEVAELSEQQPLTLTEACEFIGWAARDPRRDPRHRTALHAIWHSDHGRRAGLGGEAVEGSGAAPLDRKVVSIPQPAESSR
jgi:hypothetical protein